MGETNVHTAILCTVDLMVYCLVQGTASSKQLTLTDI